MVQRLRTGRCNEMLPDYSDNCYRDEMWWSRVNCDWKWLAGIFIAGTCRISITKRVVEHWVLCGNHLYFFLNVQCSYTLLVGEGGGNRGVWWNQCWITDISCFHFCRTRCHQLIHNHVDVACLSVLCHLWEKDTLWKGMNFITEHSVVDPTLLYKVTV